ncbi:MAG: argininosuccinate synthase, partial [Bacteroidales bacterium]|nr:argininosuccinate synthase [Bacteroidales bacterium]
ARKNGFKYIAHGSTAAGNDQVRFDLVIQVLAPGIEIITPIRDLKISREKEIEYLKKEGVEMNWTKLEYSINQGIWGTSVGGKETLTSTDELPSGAYPVPMEKSGSETVTIGFDKGEPVSLDGQIQEPLLVISDLEKLAAPWGVGRDVHVGDTIIGIKGRVGFEAAAARMIIDAHLALEKHVLTRWQLHWKEQIGQWYGMFVHEAQYLEPVMRDLESFLESSQKNVSGQVTLRLRPYSFTVTGVESPYDLMNASFATYGEMNRAWSAEEVNGFTRILGNQQRIWFDVNGTGDLMK